MSDDLDFGGGGESKYISYSSQKESWRADGENVKIANLAVDFASLKTGWGIWPEGQAMTWTFGSKISQLPPQPTEAHKSGFLVNIYDKELGWREWSTTAVGQKMGFKELFSQVKDEWKTKSDKVAIFKFVKISDTVKMGGGSTNYPIYEFTGWADKPGGSVPEPASVDDPDPVFG